MGGARSETLIFFCQSSHPHVSPQRLTKWPRQRASVFGVWGEIRSRHSEVQKHNGALHSCLLTTWTPGTAEFLLSFLDYFSRWKQGHRVLAYWETVLQVHCGLWSAEVWVGFCKDLMTRLVASLEQPVVEKVDEWEECLGEGGPLDFRIVQEKIALSQKIFLAEESVVRAGRRRKVSRPFSGLGGGGRERTTKIKQTIFQHVYLERDEDNI